MKYIYILLLLAGSVFSQQNYEIQTKATFDDSLTWVRIDYRITVDLNTETASWRVTGLNVQLIDEGGIRHFNPILNRYVTVNYTGQPVTRAAQKAATAAKFDLVYTGVEQ